jgi:hypothetical protein
MHRSSRLREAVPGERCARLIVVLERNRLFRLRLIEDFVEQVTMLWVDVVVEEAAVALQP